MEINSEILKIIITIILGAITIGLIMFSTLLIKMGNKEDGLITIILAIIVFFLLVFFFLKTSLIL